MNIPTLVAHRGDMARYPENSLPGLEAALRAGACMVEFDVQINADGEPVLLHDSTLQRTAGVAAGIFSLHHRQLARLSVHEPQRFGDRFAPVAVPLLSDALELVARCRQATALVEIKHESLQHWGLETTMDKLLDTLDPYRRQCIVISFVPEALVYARAQGDWRTGWVTTRFDDEHRHRAHSFEPDILVCNHRKIPAGVRPWPGDWRWMLYDITDPALALDYARQGVDLIETRDISAMLKDSVLKQRACSHGL